MGKRQSPDGRYPGGRPFEQTPVERVWQSLFKVYNQTLRTLGDNDFSVEHSGVRVRQRAGTLERVAKHDVGAFKAARDFLSDAEDGSSFFFFRHIFAPGKAAK